MMLLLNMEIWKNDVVLLLNMEIWKCDVLLLLNMEKGCDVAVPSLLSWRLPTCVKPILTPLKDSTWRGLNKPSWRAWKPRVHPNTAHFCIL